MPRLERPHLAPQLQPKSMACGQHTSRSLCISQLVPEQDAAFTGAEVHPGALPPLQLPAPLPTPVPPLVLQTLLSSIPMGSLDC
jgi:hypothetical protein